MKENIEKVKSQLTDNKNWRPNYTRISKNTKVPISTIRYIYNNIKKEISHLININGRFK